MANTWEHKIITITGSPDGGWENTTGLTGLWIYWTLGAGSGQQATAGSWSTTFKRGPTGATNVVATSGATWQITGVQLEVGSVCTPFEHRSYGEELALCQRYVYNYLFGGSSGNAGTELYRYYSSTNAYSSRLQFPVTMRAAPTGTIGSTPLIHAPVNNANVGGSISFQEATEQSVTLQCSPATDYGANQYTTILNTGNVIFDAEL